MLSVGGKSLRGMQVQGSPSVQLGEPQLCPAGLLGSIVVCGSWWPLSMLWMVLLPGGGCTHREHGASNHEYQVALRTQRDDPATHTQKGSERAPSPAHGLEMGSNIECRCFCRRGGARVGCPCRGEGKESRG